MRLYPIPEIIEGEGSIAELPSLLQAYNPEHVLLISDAGVAACGILDVVYKSIKGNSWRITIESQSRNEPTMAEIATLQLRLRHDRPDVILAVGGGTPLDIAKVLSVLVNSGTRVEDILGTGLVKDPGIPVIAVPTTAGTGSEVTPISVMKDERDGIKKAVVSRYIIPQTAVLDANLLLRLPQHVSAFTGMDALTHAIEAHTSTKATELTDMYALKAIEIIGSNLRGAVLDSDNVKARQNMLIASLYAGIAFTNAGVAAVHALAYPPGGLYGVPHGLANSLLLPHVVKFNLPAATERYKIVAELLQPKLNGKTNADQLVEILLNLCSDLNLPKGLASVGVPEDAIAAMAFEAAQIKRLMDNNPRPVTAHDAAALYRAAF